MIVMGIDEIPPEKVIHNRGTGPDKPSADVYPFFWSGRDNMNDPSAFLVRYELGTSSSTHYHSADQIQIVTEGKGMLGHHEYGAYSVHFARAYTPYGPLVPDKQEGWAFLTLRTRADPDGAQRLSKSREKLAKVPNRRPWQITSPASFEGRANQPVVAKPIEGLLNDEGLFGLTLRLQPGAKTTTPDASGGDGQYLIAVKGGFLHAGKQYQAMSVVFMRPNEGPFDITAGPEGLEALVINFPKVGAANNAVHADGTGASWNCNMCGYVYDEAAGDPEEGFAAGTRWKDIPEDWTCPHCGVGKQDFEKVEF